MPEILSLAGRPALSPFRLAKLLQSLSQTHSAHRIAGIAATYWHFVELRRPLAALERTTLERLLTYGPEAGERYARDRNPIARGSAPGHDFALVVEGDRHRAATAGSTRGRAHRARRRVPRDERATARRLPPAIARRCCRCCTTG